MKKILSFSGLIISSLFLSNLTLASPTLVIHDSAEDFPITITYRVCDTGFEPSVCTPATQYTLSQRESFAVDLKNKDFILYILKADMKHGERLIASSTYGNRENGGSYCETFSHGFITLNTHYTNRIGCAMLSG